METGTWAGRGPRADQGDQGGTIVRVDAELCINCRKCVAACPFGAMQFDEQTEVAMVCDLCRETLERDEKPAYTEVCPTQCILWGDVKGISEEMEWSLLQEVGR